MTDEIFKLDWSHLGPDHRCNKNSTNTWGTASYHRPMVVILCACNLLAVLGCLYTMAAILSNKGTRRVSFNLCVVFLLIPDAINNAVIFVFGMYRYECGRVPKNISNAYDMNVFFYYFANFSMNALIAVEIYSILEQSKRRRRLGAPSMKRTLLRAMGVYTFAILFSAWGAVDVSWSWWNRRRSKFGSPPPNGVFSETEAIALAGSLMVAFIVFVLVIRILIRRRDLLPKSGQTRVLSLFFERIVVVFFVFYVPTLVLLISTVTLLRKGSPWDASYFWIERTLHLLSALQVFVTLGVVVQKPDLRSVIVCDGQPREQHRSSRFSSRRRNSTTAGSTQQVSGLQSAWTVSGRATAAATIVGPGEALEASEVPSDVEEPLSSSQKSSGFLSSNYRGTSRQSGFWRSFEFDTSEWFEPDVYESTGTEEDDEVKDDGVGDGSEEIDQENSLLKDDYADVTTTNQQHNDTSISKDLENPMDDDRSSSIEIVFTKEDGD